MAVPVVQIIEGDVRVQCCWRMPWRAPILGNRRAALAHSGLDPRCCRDHSWVLIDGSPHCRLHAKERAMDWLLDNQEERT